MCYTKEKYIEGVLFVPQFLTKKFPGYIFVKKFENHKYSLMHSHEYLELAYVLEGDGITTINGKSEPLKKGDFYVIDYDSSHSYESEYTNFKIISSSFLRQHSLFSQ